MDWNPDQIKSVAARLTTSAAAIALAVGVVNSAQATELTSSVSVIVNSGLAIAGAITTIWSMVDAWWKHSHPAQIAAGVRSAQAIGVEPGKP